GGQGFSSPENSAAPKYTCPCVIVTAPLAPVSAVCSALYRVGAMSLMFIEPERSSKSSTYGVDCIGVKCTAAQLVSGMLLPGMQWPSLVPCLPAGDIRTPGGHAAA